MVMELDVIDFKAKLPNDFKELSTIDYGLKNKNRRVLYIIQDGFIYFGSDVKFDKITIEYKQKIN